MLHHLRNKYEQKIQTIVADGFECELLSAALDNLNTTGPLCINNFSYALRELLRHMLQRLAIDEKRKECSWYKKDKSLCGGVTRAHRATYAIQGGLSDTFVIKKLGIDVVNARKKLLETIDILSKYTHIEPATFGINQIKADCLATECLEATQYFIEHIFDCRNKVVESLAEHIDHHLLEHVISETIDSVDILATHHSIDEIYVNNAEVINISSKTIDLVIEGSISCELQYGSNSDVKNDIGALISTSFPFFAELTVQLERPLGKFASVVNFTVDTSRWYK